MSQLRIALAGNPNAGKTTLFNVLTGSNQYVGNWPGVTVEKKEGRLLSHDDVILTDLPGIYSLSPYTAEEQVARRYLVGERPDAILNIIDGTNLERNLYLTTQLTELGIPVVLAVNMIDVLRHNGDTLQIDELGRRLGCRVVEISALKGTGIREAAEAAIAAAKEATPIPVHAFSGTVEHAIAHIEEAALHDLPLEKQRWYAIKIFENDSRVLKELAIPQEKLAHIREDIRAAEAEMDDDAESIITNERYVYVSTLLKGCYKRKNAGKQSLSDNIDRVLTNRYLGLPIFALIMFSVYFLAMASVGQICNDFVNERLFGTGFTLFGHHVASLPDALSASLSSSGAAPWLSSLLVDGILAGVGAVLGFVPQMFILFLLLSLLEDCGYMSRIAFVLDRIFRRFGLAGKSFIPMLIGTGCSVPGIMASRTVESEQDRRMTVITTSFIPCGAKVPFIGLIAGVVFGGSPAIATGAYLLGIAAVVVSGLILKKTAPFQGKPAPFVMELPSYHLPYGPSVLRATWDRGWSYVKKAGTVILLFTVILWFATYFGIGPDGAFRMLTQEEADYSILAYLGSLVAWIFLPLGFGNWRAAVASLTGLIAKENIVASLEVLLGEEGIRLAFPPVTALSFLVFNLLCAPCVAAMGAIRQEMQSAKWTAFALLYQSGFAYAVSLMIYQFGNLFYGCGNVAGVVFASLVLAGLIYLLVRKNPYAVKET